MKKNKINQTDKEDLRLVRKAKKGNQKAFETLVVKYQKAIYGLARKMVLNHDDTNDIVQDTFVKAYRNLERFDEKYSFYPWLHRITINTTLNFIEKNRRYKETFNRSENQDVFSSQNDNSLKKIIHREYKQQIKLALEMLPLDQRVVFILRTSEELSYQEISEQLEVSIGTVMSRLSRAREKLKELLKPYLESKEV
ncbi:sigma-70 family RNA polymerase sigma factor [candidate division KSB1 bacterium]|nr:sigma-70 family RNA polymerase sigma factor [candidate division KSB1 bacterium]MBL7092944.1 sigma-70 family RNA polymerase sigma factor [candidate division KSB1 bacterium]